MIADQQYSGLSAVAYCTEHGIEPTHFSAPKTQLQSSSDGNFVRLTPKASPISEEAVPFTKAMPKQPRIRVIDIELSDALDVRSLSLILNQVLS